MSENGEIYTAGKNFTLSPAPTGWTNSTSGWLVLKSGIKIRTFWLFQHLKITANDKIGSGDLLDEEEIKHGLYELMDL